MTEQPNFNLNLNKIEQTTQLNKCVVCKLACIGHSVRLGASACVRMCTCGCGCAHVFAYICVRTCARVHMCTCVLMCVLVCVRVYMHFHVWACVQMPVRACV